MSVRPATEASLEVAIREFLPQPYLGKRFRTLTTEDVGRGVQQGYAELFAKLAATTYRGPYDAIGPTYEAFSAWILANGHTMAGPPREVYLTGPQEIASPDQQVTEIVWPIG